VRPRVLVLRAPGTNCDEETARALREAGASPEVVHVGRLLRGEVDPFDYHGLVIPGGFSYGDRVRAGAVLASKLVRGLGRRLEGYVEEGYPVLGICNGFQVLVEAGLLPGDGLRAAFAPNVSSRFEARWVRLRVEDARSAFTRGLSEGEVLRMPVAHAEGRFVADGDALRRMASEGLVVLRYAKPDGSPAGGEYPHNPNGSAYDVAALRNRRGNVLGLMPHPERAVYAWQLPERRGNGYADGWRLFRSMVEYMAAFT